MRKQFIIVIFILGFLFSCSPTKYIPKGEHLLHSYETKTDDKTVANFEFYAYVKQKPNKKIFGLPLYARIYNTINPEKEAKREKRRKVKEDKMNMRRLKKGKEPREKIALSRTVLKIGEKPVIYDENQSRKTSKQLELFLKNKGYYLAKVKDSVAFNDKKAKVTYKINPGKPYTIRNYKDSITDTEVSSIVSNYLKKSKIKKGKVLESELLTQERTKITELLYNQGYYQFSKEYIYFSIDTFIGNNQADILLSIKNPKEQLPDGEMEETTHVKFLFDALSILPDYEPSNILSEKKKIIIHDTIKTDKKISFLIANKNKYTQSVLKRGLRIETDSLYRASKVKSSFEYYSSLSNFKLINISFTESAKYNDTLNYPHRYLDTQIKLTPSIMQSFTVELEGNTTNGRYGMASNLLYQHLNIFGGAQILNVKLKAELSNKEAIAEESNNYFSETEYGVTASIYFPNLLAPFNTKELYLKVFPKTNVSLGYNFRENSNYKKNVFITTFGYSWKTKNMTHQFNLIEFNSVKLTNISSSYLSELFQTNQFQEKYDHVILGSSYSFTYSNQDIKKQANFMFFKTKIELAGKILNTINKSTKADKLSAGEYFRRVYELIYETEQEIDNSIDSLNNIRPGFYTLNNIPYAQFSKIEIDFRYYQILDSKNEIVYRINPGVIIPFGNSYYSPQEKQFFLGGASSMRAWQARTLGPGSNSDAEQLYQYGDIKLEMNLEYRFHLFWMVEGALFTDVGNIWSLDVYDNTENKDFSFKDFYKDLAVGTGFGVRADLDFFIFRFDFGFKMHDPAIVNGSKWIGLKAFTYKNMAFNFGIGYPF